MLQAMEYQKGLGAQFNTVNKFVREIKVREYTDADLEEINTPVKASYTDIFPKTIVNRVTSPDVGLEYSLNPYQGCEHGCVYCYARNSHEFWGYSAGIDFERKILVKRNAPELLEAFLQNPKWKAAPIVLSGNTDCYQPVEKELEITRELLKVFLKYKHPVGIITKNALVLRDIDILKQLAELNLVKVIISVTSLSEKVRRKLEPRTASTKQKLKAIKELHEAGIPVGVNMGPIIPGLNNHEIFDIAKATADVGAQTFNYTMVHLNGQIADIFKDWIHKAFPLKANHVLNLIREVHDGKLNNSKFGERKRGNGEVARMIRRQVVLAKEINFKGRGIPEYNLDLHKSNKTNQMSLF